MSLYDKKGFAVEGIGIFIFFIIISIVSNVAKQNKKSQQTKTNTQQRTNPVNSSTMVQDSIRDLVGQIEKKINDAAGMSTPNIQNQRVNTAQQKSQSYNPSLEGTKMEGYQMEGAKVEGYQMEGAKVEGHRVEGVPLEHRHSYTFDKNKKNAHTELSMGRKYAGEGCKTHYNKTIQSAKVVKKSASVNPVSLDFSDNPIVQGLVMSQVLERPKRRY